MGFALRYLKSWVVKIEVRGDLNFFEQQDRSRQATKTLLGLFTAAVMSTGICVYFAVILTINITFLNSTVFGDRVCQPIVPVSGAIQPRSIGLPTAIPLLPATPHPDFRHLFKTDGRGRDLNSG